MSSLLLALVVVLGVDPPAEGHFITDATQTVSPAAKAQVDELAATVHVGGFGELMVLVVDTTGKTPIDKHATLVFSTWPVGHAENVDGALLVIAVKDKKAALVLGDGYGRIAAKETDALVNDAVLPSLKAGKLDDAVVGGARAVLRLLEKHHVKPSP